MIRPLVIELSAKPADKLAIELELSNTRTGQFTVDLHLLDLGQGDRRLGSRSIRPGRVLDLHVAGHAANGCAARNHRRTRRPGAAEAAADHRRAAGGARHLRRGGGGAAAAVGHHRRAGLGAIPGADPDPYPRPVGPGARAGRRSAAEVRPRGGAAESDHDRWSRGPQPRRNDGGGQRPAPAAAAGRRGLAAGDRNRVAAGAAAAGLEHRAGRRSGAVAALGEVQAAGRAASRRAGTGLAGRGDRVRRGSGGDRDSRGRGAADRADGLHHCACRAATGRRCWRFSTRAPHRSW